MFASRMQRPSLILLLVSFLKSSNSELLLYCASVVSSWTKIYFRRSLQQYFSSKSDPTARNNHFFRSDKASRKTNSSREVLETRDAHRHSKLTPRARRGRGAGLGSRHGTSPWRWSPPTGGSRPAGQPTRAKPLAASAHRTFPPMDT